MAARVEAIERREIVLPWHLGGQADFFMLFVVAAGAAGVSVLALSPMLRGWARPAEPPALAA